MRQKTDLIANLKVMLHDVLAAHAQGVSHARVARAHGYVDGYMRALLDTGIVGHQELLTLVAEERSRVHGPAVAEVVAA